MPNCYQIILRSLPKIKLINKVAISISHNPVQNDRTKHRLTYTLSKKMLLVVSSA